MSCRRPHALAAGLMPCCIADTMRMLHVANANTPQSAIADCRWEDGEAVRVRLDGPDREQVQAAERLTLRLQGGRGEVAIQQRVRRGHSVHRLWVLCVPEAPHVQSKVTLQMGHANSQHADGATAIVSASAMLAVLSTDDLSCLRDDACRYPAARHWRGHCAWPGRRRMGQRPGAGGVHRQPACRGAGRLVVVNLMHSASLELCQLDSNNTHRAAAGAWDAARVVFTSHHRRGSAAGAEAARPEPHTASASLGRGVVRRRCLASAARGISSLSRQMHQIIV
jgi:hypothetical protein